MKQKNNKQLLFYNTKISTNQTIKIVKLIKKLSILYSLLIFSKKHFKNDFTNFPSNLFFILLLPLLGYTLDKQKFLSNNINNSESFFYKTLPGLNNLNKINLSNLTWETFNYTEYFKKINWNTLKQLSYFDSSIFISFNSNLYNKNFYIGTYDTKNFSNKIISNSNNSTSLNKDEPLNKYFISGRNFNQFFKAETFHKDNFLLLDTKNYSNTLILKDNYLRKQNFLKLKTWQLSLYEVDHIPLKLNNIFYSNIDLMNYNILKATKAPYLTKPLFNNLFFYTKKTFNKKNNLIKLSFFKTTIEKKNRIFDYELFTKKATYPLYNFRFFHYKVYNKLFLFKKFLNYQVNTFSKTNEKKSFYNFIIHNNYSLLDIPNNKKFIQYIKNQNEPNWQNLIRKDLKNLGSTKNEKFIYSTKLLTKSLHLNNSYLKRLTLKEKNKIENSKINFVEATIKTPISLQSRENKNIVIKKNNEFNKKINNKKLNNKLYYSNLKLNNQQSTFLPFGSSLIKKPKNKKYSFLYYFEREFYYYLEFLTKKNKSLKLNKSFDNYNILSFIFNNKNNVLIQNLNEDKLNKSNINEINYKTNKFKDTVLLKNRIIETNSHFLKRKTSGHLYPDIQKSNLSFITNSKLYNNSFIQIKGPKNLIYKKFNNFSINPFFLSNEKNIINFTKEELHLTNKNNNLYLKSKNNLLKLNNFFGNTKMDFGLGFSYTKNKNLETTEIDKSNYQPNLSLMYSKQRLDSKCPFSWQYPIKDDWLLNNNNYFHSLLIMNKPVYNSNLDKNFKLKSHSKNNKTHYLFEVCDFNKIPLVPISYKSYFKYNKNYDNLNSIYSNFIKNFNNLFNTDLYEFISFKQWSLLTQISFLLIFLKLINNLKENYGESFLTAFKTFFNNFEFDALINLKIEVGKTIKSKKIKFNDLVGGRFFLQEFNQTILLLKNSKFGFQSNLNIKKPDFIFNSMLINNKKFFLYSKTSKYKNLFFIINDKQKTSISNFIYNPLYSLFSKYKITLNNKFTIKNLQNKIYIKGFLLVGPPGTGKTLLVKALSGEAEVPIVLESGEKLSKLSSSNDTMSENAKGALELKNLFKRAKKLSPCILFLDEIDSVGKNRKDVLTDYRKKKLLNSSTTSSSYFLSNNKINIRSLNLNQFNLNNINNLNLYQFNLKNYYMKNNDNSIFPLQNNSNNNLLNGKSLSMLTQLLCELDGLKDRCNLVIIGATNRPKTLDPALTRPGRLSKIVYIDLPGKQKRFELLKFYSKNKIQNINWEFFANQTTGLSAAHLSSSLNISLLKTIYNFINFKIKSNLKLVNNFTVKNKFYLTPTFDDIEYGIQTTKFRNSSFNYKCYELGLLINSLIININYYNQLKLITVFNFSKFILYYQKITFINNNIIKKKWANVKITQNKISLLKQVSRTIFYKKNRKFIRCLYLLNDKSNINKLVTTKFKTNYFINKFSKYTTRLFNVTLFSCHLLLFSTYIINNPLIISFNFFYDYSKSFLYYNVSTMINRLTDINRNQYLIFDKNFITFKYNNLLKYKLLYYNFKLTNSISFFSSKKFFYKQNKIFSLDKKITVTSIKNNFNITKEYLNTQNYFNLYHKANIEKKNRIQQLIFSDSSFINRISYYIGGKALISIILKKPILNFNTGNLWLVKNKLDFKIKKKLFVEQSLKKLINKEDFENYLFFIITGKISEIKMLLNSNSLNLSNFASYELKELNWLINIMINKNYFYKTFKVKLLNKILVQNAKSFSNNKQKVSILVNKFDKYFIVNKQKTINNSSKNFNFWTVIPYWWEPNLKVKNINIMHWSIFFKKSKKLNFLSLLLKESSQYYYFSNSYTNKSNTFLNYNNFIIKSNKKTNLYSNKSINYNKLKTVFEYETNWNSILIIEYYILMSNLIIYSFNKIFNLLESNVELMDYLIYYILCNERFYDFELATISSKYYNFENN